MSEKRYADIGDIYNIRAALDALKGTKHSISRKALAEQCPFSKSKLDKMLHLKKEKLYIDDEEIDGEMVPIYDTYDVVSYSMTMEEYEAIVLVLNPLLEAEGMHWYGLYDSPQRRAVLDKTRASLDQLIELLNDDAHGMHDLEAYAWDLYRKRYPRRPAFCDYAAPRLWDAGFTHPGSAVWDTATDAERQTWADCWKKAKIEADKLVGQHIEAERLHQEAEEAAAVSSVPSWIEIEGARDDGHKYIHDNISLTQWWRACPPSEEYDRDRHRIELEIERQTLDEKLAEDDA